MTRHFRTASIVAFLAVIGAAFLRPSLYVQSTPPSAMPDLSDRDYDFLYRITLPDADVMTCLENFTGLPCNSDMLPFVQGPIELGGDAANSTFLPRPMRNGIGYTRYCTPHQKAGLISFVETAALSQAVGALSAYVLPSSLEPCIQMQPPDYEWPERSVLIISNTGIVGAYDCSLVDVRVNPNCSLDYYFGDGRYRGSTFPIPLRSLGPFVEAFPSIIRRLLQEAPGPFPTDFVVPTFAGTVEITPDAQQFINQSREALN